MYVYKYVDQKGLVAMLTIKRSESVTPEVNLRNLLHKGDETQKQGINPGIEIQDRNRGTNGPTRGLTYSKNYFCNNNGK